MRTRSLAAASLVSISMLAYAVSGPADALPATAPHPPRPAESRAQTRAQTRVDTRVETRPAEIVGAAQQRLATAKSIDLTRWRGAALREGSFTHTHRDRRVGGVVIGPRPTRVSYDDPYGPGGRRSYDRGTWTSPWARPGFGFDRLVASYNASTPVGTFIEVFVRGRTTGGRLGSWDSLGRWASHDKGLHRMSLGSQRDDVARVSVDTLVARPGIRLRAWQLKVSLLRRAGTGRTPVLQTIGAVSSHLPSHSRTSRPGRGAGHVLAVPRYSQEIHRGEYPQYNGGGEAWCSPTSTSMVMGFWHRLPTKRQYSWVDPSYRDPWVDHAARYTFAWGYDGTGDWPFNTAYAARFGLDTFVSRLRSLREAELFIRAGIPLVASISFGAGELDGAPISSTNGHLVVIRGFTADGRVVVNDPAAANDRGVRHVYKRGQFENAWVDNGGVVYVIHPRSTPLPDPRHHSNW